MLPHNASQQGNYAIAELLLGHGANVNARGWDHKTPLHLASLGGSLDVSWLLIEHGADVDIQDDTSQTPFSMALLEHRKLVRLLLIGRVPEHDVWYLLCVKFRDCRVKLDSSTAVAAEVDNEVTTIERQNAKVVQPIVRL